MIEKYVSIINDVISLAREREKEPSLLDADGSKKEFLVLGRTMENPKFEILNKKLVDYLDSLDYETIKVLQTLMYLGRDKDYDKKLVGEEIYNDYRKYMDDSIGWSTKEIDTDKLVEKAPLADYLKAALDIFNL